MEANVETGQTLKGLTGHLALPSLALYRQLPKQTDKYEQDKESSQPYTRRPVSPVGTAICQMPASSG
ncbi:hypothetical protein ASAP_0053 [Asaia bogorensis]|uniref:Uncharacterized protein n=1 Tax=Asaia bogorensis TaxID=91915 RepID=A0A060QBN0_9PROT|nr:hypothetical protein ASAP_0053 [Asaia bogorensis]